MSEFAFSGLGLNPHFGTPLSPGIVTRRGSPAARRRAAPSSVCRSDGACGARYRHRRVVPHPGGVLRAGRLQADRRSHSARRSGAAVDDARLGRFDRPLGGLLRGARRDPRRALACRRPACVRPPGCGWRRRRITSLTAWTRTVEAGFDAAIASLRSRRRDDRSDHDSGARHDSRDQRQGRVRRGRELRLAPSAARDPGCAVRSTSDRARPARRRAERGGFHRPPAGPRRADRRRRARESRATTRWCCRRCRRSRRVWTRSTTTPTMGG